MMYLLSVIFGLLAFSAILIGSFVVLWVMYGFAMALKYAQEQKTLLPTGTKIGTVLFFICYAWDIICNLVFATVLFWERPREFTVSARLQRLVDAQPHWRQTLALWFAKELLNSLSFGKQHIRIPDHLK